MSGREKIQRIDLPRPSEPPSDSKISVDDRLTEPIGVHVVEREQTLLFGTGYEESFQTLLDQLQPSHEPDVVVVEHGDPDHYGAVPKLRETFEDLTVAAPLGDIDQLDEVDITVDVTLEHGDEIGGFEVVHIPGHTPGNLSFVDEDSGILVVGDSFVGADSAIAASGTWTGAFAMMRPAFNADNDGAMTNLSRLDGYSFDVALLTHGADVTEGADDELATLRRDVLSIE